MNRETTFTKTPKAVLLVVFAVCVLVFLGRPMSLAWAANPLKYGQPIKGNLGPGQTVDYTFAGKTGDKLTVTMNATGGELDPFISLYDSQGKLIGENDNAGKYSAQLQGIVLPVDGSYKLVAANSNKSGSGQFGLIVLRETAKGAVYYDGKPSDKQFYQLSQPLNHTNVTYRLANTQPGFDPQQVRNVIAQAFQSWSDVTPLRFQEVTGQSDLEIQFASIDGPLNVLGETCPPSSPCAGQIQFDSDETWTMGPPQSEQDISFLGVAAHEFGHAIGLLHSDDPNALMYYAYSPYNIKPGPDDIDGVQRLYGPGSGRANSSPTTIPGANQNPNQPVVQGTIDDQHFAEFWDFDVEAGDTVTITMKKTSGNLDSTLVLLDANNNILAYDDDGAGGYDSMLRNVRFPQRGTYTVAATRYEQAQGFTTGNYQLSIDYNNPSAGNVPVATTIATQPNAGNGNGIGNVKVSKGQTTSLGQLPSLDSTIEGAFDPSLSPGTQTRNATVQRAQSYVWTATWCAKDDATVQQNVQNISMSFAVNGKAIDSGLITRTTPHALNGLSCVDYLVVLSDWSGNQVSLTSTMTLRDNLFDGNNIFAKGSYIYQYNVQVQG